MASIAGALDLPLLVTTTGTVPLAFLVIESNPHAMLPVFAGLQAAFLKTLSTHYFASFLRQMR
jgi:hypothetical protein